MPQIDDTHSNIKLTVAYDGTAFLGWQKTSMGPSIEESLQRVLEQILQEPIVLQAASRTDAGVHAEGQIVNFFTHKAIPCMTRLQIGINSLLPPDIAVLAAEHAALDFHPTLDCKRKEYRYSVCYGTAQMPQKRLYSWHYPHLLDVISMRDASQALIGEHDFSAFCNFKKNHTYTDYVRKIDRIDILELPEQRLSIHVQGNNFLYKMVRNLIGTLIYVGAGKISIEAIPEILTSHDRPQAGMTAPAHGLTLHRIWYQG